MILRIRISRSGLRLYHHGTSSGMSTNFGMGTMTLHLGDRLFSRIPRYR